MPTLADKHRPRDLADVVGQPRAVAVCQRFLGKGGRAFWISGASGTGKTTLARILAASFAEPDKVIELSSADELTADRLTDLEYHVLPYCYRKAIIVNEAHALKAAVVRRLLGDLENIPESALWLFTTTRDGEEKLFEDNIEESPLLSRVVQLRLTNQGLAQAFAERVRTIAMAEGLDGQPIEAYVKLAQKCKNNCRAMLARVEAGDMLT